MGVIILGLGLFGVIAVATLVAALSIGLPDVKDLQSLNAAQSTEIFDRDGNLLYTIHGEENREEVTFDQISKDLINATVAIEDNIFWEHAGYDIWAIGKAALNDIFGIGQARGGSTITQQYIKNTFLSSERSYTRKAKEIILAIRLEKAYTKEEIMGLYLNRIPLGNNAYGCEKAAEIYFQKTCLDLDIAESSILAAIIQAPTRYNPYGNNRYSHLLKDFSSEELEKRNIKSELDLKIDEYTRGLIGATIELGPNKIYIPGRADIVLSRMEALGYINDEERQDAIKKLSTLEFQQSRSTIKHPHFTLYVKQQLEEKYGKELVEQGGLKVYTTIDTDLQTYAEEVAKERGELNEKNYESNNVALMTVNPNTGEILAMVGSRDYFNTEIDGNVNVTIRPRQPGSSFKPIVYAKAFYNGYGPGNVIYDVPTRIGNNTPKNYEGNFQGQMSVRRALAQSRNIPAIKMFFLAGEEKEIIPFAKQIGFTSLKDNYPYGYPLALGSGEVTMYEMVRAYSTFATNGRTPELTPILRVETANGDILEEWNPGLFPETMDPQVAYLINSILSDKEHSLGTAIQVDGKNVAVKTGTSTKEDRSQSGNASVRPGDTWTIGYTPTTVTAVWAGNTDGTGLGYNASGYTIAAPVFKSVMTKALEEKVSETFPQPKGVTKVSISKASGKLPSASTPQDQITEDIFASFSVPTEVDNSYFRVTIDTVSGLLATEFTPASKQEERVFQNYEPIADLLNWQAEIRNYYRDREIGLPPTEYDNVHTPEAAANGPQVQIISPSTNSSVAPGRFDVQISVSANHGVENVEYFINDQPAFRTDVAPYSGSLRMPSNVEIGSRQLIVVKVTDKYGYTSQSAIEVKVGDENSIPIEDSPPEDTNTPENPPPSNSDNNGNGGNNGNSEAVKPDNNILKALL